MTTKIPLLTLSVVPSVAIADGLCVSHAEAPAGAAAAVLGVAEYDIAAGFPGAVTVRGVARTKTGAAIAKGDALKTDAQGRVIPQAGAGIIMGHARAAASAADQFIAVLLTGAGA